ncbi:hypothetical protein C789_4081 [Microcystis aeruginosa FACHB-905 = DIANCHI905]|nr:hypothetical protein C789_4081 [Microcystis aeruginosa FACHB-905 = DIANCHI905]
MAHFVVSPHFHHPITPAPAPYGNLFKWLEARYINGLN